MVDVIARQTARLRQLVYLKPRPSPGERKSGQGSQTQSLASQGQLDDVVDQHQKCKKAQRHRCVAVGSHLSRFMSF